MKCKILKENEELYINMNDLIQGITEYSFMEGSNIKGIILFLIGIKKDYNDEN